jgi:hypothetical protein
MSNTFGIVLDSAAVRRATTEGVSETVIAAVLLLHERSVADIASKLTQDDLRHVIRLVGRCPSCYPPGTLDALKGQSPTPSPEPVVDTSTNEASSRPANRIKPNDDYIRRANERGGLRAHPLRTAPEHERAVTPEKSGTRTGTVDETARRRLIVEDLSKAGLSVRMISGATDIPRSSVHRAMRAITRFEAKKQVATAEMANELLGRRLSHRGRGRP